MLSQLAAIVWLSGEVATTAEPDPRIGVVWDAPATCPDQADVERRLAGQLEDLADTPRRSVSVAARVTRDAVGGWRLEARLSSADGVDVRELVLDSCDAAIEALTLMVSLTMAPPDGGATQEEPVVPAPRVPESVAEPTPRVPAMTSSAAADRGPVATPASTSGRTRAAMPPRRPRGALRLAGGAGFGVLATAGGQIAAELSLLWPRLQLGIRVGHGFRRELRPAALAGAGVDLSLVTAGVAVGPAFERRQWRIAVLAFGDVGALRARGVGAPRTASLWVPFGAVGASVSALWAPRRWVALGPVAELDVALVRHTFTLAPGVEVRRTGQIGGRLLCAVEFRVGAATIR